MIIAIIILMMLAVGLYVCITQKDEPMYEDEINVDIEIDEQMPLQDKTYRIQNHYNNVKQDSRTDALINIMQKIHFWLVIIGLYCLIKIIAWLVVVITGGAVLTEIIDMLLAYI